MGEAFEDAIAGAVSGEEVSEPTTESSDSPIAVPSSEPTGESEGASSGETAAPSTPEQGETAEETAERLLAGKYKSADELERAYEEAQRRMGEMKNELGQLRDAFASDADQVATSAMEQGAPDPRQIDAFIEQRANENPVAALQESVQIYEAALAAGDRATIRAVIRSVRDNLDESAADQLEDHWEDYREEQRQAPLHYQSFTNALTQAGNQLLADHPESAELAESIADVIRENPALLGDHSPQALQRGFEHAYRIAAYDAGVTVGSQVQSKEEAQSQREAYANAATVLSDSRVPPAESEDVDEGNKIFEDILNAKQPLR